MRELGVEDIGMSQQTCTCRDTHAVAVPVLS